MVGLKEIASHKFRSALTMMGIILGVASLVGLSALVKGMENGMREAMEAIGGIEKVSVFQISELFKVFKMFKVIYYLKYMIIEKKRNQEFFFLKNIIHLKILERK